MHVNNLKDMAANSLKYLPSLMVKDRDRYKVRVINNPKDSLVNRFKDLLSLLVRYKGKYKVQAFKVARLQESRPRRSPKHRRRTSPCPSMVRRAATWATRKRWRESRNP